MNKSEHLVQVVMWGFCSERCEHQWIPRNKEQEPSVCPKCKSPYWNRPRRVRGETAGQGDSIGYVGFSEQATEEFFGDAW